MAEGRAAKREACVISLAVITDAVSNGKPPPPLEIVEVLHLPFRSIIQLAGLDALTSLRELRLDNNAISVIEGLSALSRLEVLDLSFNCITRVRGLGGLSHLTDLSLFCNAIEHIDSGLTACGSLQCLSLGSNQLSNLDEVLLLRGLGSLAALTLAGNPFAKAPTRSMYTSWCLAVLPRLKYLDHALVTPAQVAAARESGSVATALLASLDEKDAAAAATTAVAAVRAAERSALAASRLDVLATLGDDVFDEDTFPAHAKAALPGSQAVQAACLAAFERAGALLRDDAAPLVAAMADETQEASVVAADIIAGADATICARLHALSHAVKLAAAHVSAGSSSPLHCRRQREELEAAASSFGTVALADEACVSLLETTLAALRSRKLGAYERYFRAAEAAINAHDNAVKALADAAVAAGISVPVTAAPGSAAKRAAATATLLLGEDAAAASAAASAPGPRGWCDPASLAPVHELHVARLLKREAEVRAREETAVAAVVDDLRSVELQRNRRRVHEIGQLTAAALIRLPLAASD